MANAHARGSGFEASRARLRPAALALLGLGLLAPRFSRSDEPCPDVGARIVVDVQARTMRLCGYGRPLAHFAVALGHGGLDKRQHGDRKTPLGTYELGVPRPSARFGMFIPVAYPTADQRRQGYTGGDVGIHGPHRRTAWAGEANTWSDWTDGCIALGSDEELTEVASFVRAHRPALLVR
ncbi:MAG TPA: L,D-transpeptidase family protein [Anaeromyxobacteraceae bacterium]|nr:L,D-transpeptidase family protein [Anaeromyxobacteraceae bacterium]